jgi:hypothetical protein
MLKLVVVHAMCGMLHRLEVLEVYQHATACGNHVMQSALDILAVRFYASQKKQIL